MSTGISHFAEASVASAPSPQGNTGNSLPLSDSRLSGALLAQADQSRDQYVGETPAASRDHRRLLHFPANQVRGERKYGRVSSCEVRLDPTKAIDSERLAQTLWEVLPIPSKSCRETLFVRHAQSVFRRLGLQVTIDDLPKQVARMGKGERGEFYCNEGLTKPHSGNLMAFLSATDPSLPSWNLNFHFDTLQESFGGIRREGDTISPAKGTPLGSDDKAGFAIIVEVIRTLLENKVPHGDIRVVGLVGEEDTAGGARLIASTHMGEDVLVSVDGTEPQEIGRAAPTMYKGYVVVRTHTSHPFAVDKQKSVSACAVGNEFMERAGFRPDTHPPGHPDVVLHTYFESCGLDEGEKTDFGVPKARPKYNTIAPYWTAAWQMRNLEGPEKAAEMARHLKETLKQACDEASVGRTPVECEITGTGQPSLVGYVVPEDDPGIALLKAGLETVGLKPEVTARQFGGFNGNFIHSRFGATTILTGTGASNYIHTHLETASVAGMTKAAQGLLAALLESYCYKRF